MATTTYNPLYQGVAEIPTLTEWRRVSTASRFKFLDRRGSSEIRAIDQCVSTYTAVSANSKASTVQLWEAAVNLLEACEVYLATPRGHKQHRQDAVFLLKKNTLVVLAKLRWQKLKDVSGGYKPGMKPMVQHVWSEMHSPGHARVGHGDNMLDPDPWLRGAPEAKEKYLFQYLRKVRAEGAKPDNVLYIEDSDKWKYQIVFSRETGLAYQRAAEMGGRILQSDIAITTKGWDNLSTIPYAVDENGVFYTETSNHSGGTINHCSFLSGRPVMCAGNIGITNGVIGYIDNGSGHYRPTLENLLRCLKALKEQVSPVSFDAIVVRNHAGKYPLAGFLAGKFLALRGQNLRPVGYYPSAGPGTHYRTSLVEFKGGDDLVAYMDQQDLEKQRTKLEADLKGLLGRLENGRVNNQLTGKLSNDADRTILQAVLSASFIPDAQKDGLKRYYQNDERMLLWVRSREKVQLRPRAGTR